MEKRIKTIYLITIVALVALFVFQGYWLWNQYIYTLQKYEDELYQETLDVLAEDRIIRRNTKNENTNVMTRWQKNIVRNDSTSPIPKIEYILEAFVVDMNKLKTDISILQADSLADKNKGVTKYRFVLMESNNEHNVYNAFEQFCLNRVTPFQNERFDSLLHTKGLSALSMKMETIDSTIWTPHLIRHTSLIHPTMQIVYPYDILHREQLRVIYSLGISPILGRMFTFLVGSILLFLLLMFCLVYQIVTIFRLRRVEELRKDFIKTMIHELKRPLTTLKLCLSYMKSDKMMQDKAMKDDILLSSQNELDNLSSYFSKLRDLTCGEMEEIPLNLSTFDLKELIEKCIAQQNHPSGKAISINATFDKEPAEITADRMHLANIFSNLIENAIKYSEEKVAIHITCHSQDDNYMIEVADDGIGISSTECKYIFDKYFRSASIHDKKIPGMGLGLSYVKMLVEAHKGSISVESELGKGSKFVIIIPKRQ